MSHMDSDKPVPVENVEDILPRNNSPSPSLPPSYSNVPDHPHPSTSSDSPPVSAYNSECNSPASTITESSLPRSSAKPGLLPPPLPSSDSKADPKAAPTAENTFNKKWWHGYKNTLDPRKDEVPIQVALLSALGEFIGTFLFVFYATAVVVAATYLLENQGGATNTLVIAFGQGFSLALSIYVVAPVSGGHLNPAVTISVFVVQRITLVRALLYIFAQFAGAIAAAAVTKGIYPSQFQDSLGATVVNPVISLTGAFFLEVIMTFMLVFVMFSTAIDPRGVGKLAPIAIGLVVLIDELIGASFTGASMNPARTLGPALIQNAWNHYWLYFFAPVIGAIIAAVMYEQYLGTFDQYHRFLPQHRAQSLRRKRRKEWMLLYRDRRQKRRAEGKKKKHGLLKTSMSNASDSESENESHHDARNSHCCTGQSEVYPHA